MTKIRVANIIEEGKLGGPQVYIADVAKSLKSQVETTVILPLENSDQFRAKLEAYGVPYKVFNLSRITKEFKVALRYVFFSWLEILQLFLYFRKENFDLIYACGGSWQYKGVIAGKLAGMKVVWHLNDTYAPNFIRKIFSYCSWLPNAYIYASERTRDYYRSLIPGSKPGFVIPAPVDTVLFDSIQCYPGDEELIEAWEGKFVIGTVANINPIKGLDVFIRAAAEINKKVLNAQFVVIGSIYQKQQPYWAELKELCMTLGVKNIDFVGPRSDVRSLLKRFDVYICSSMAESSPIAVWEAMAMGKLIVATDVGDVALYVHDGKNGFVVRVGDYQEVAEQTVYLCNHKDIWPAFKAGTRKIAVKELDVKQCASRHQVAYFCVVGDKYYE